MTKFRLSELDPDYGREVVVLDDDRSEPADLAAADYGDERERDRLNRLRSTRAYRQYLREHRDHIRFARPAV